MAKVTIKQANYGRRAGTRSGAPRVWIPNQRIKEVKVKDSKLPKPAGKQSTLTAADANKVKRGKIKSDKEPGAVNVKRKTAWSKR